MASFSLRGIIGLLALISTGAGLAVALETRDDTSSELPESLAFAAQQMPSEADPTDPGRISSSAIDDTPTSESPAEPTTLLPTAILPTATPRPVATPTTTVISPTPSPAPTKPAPTPTTVIAPTPPPTPSPTPVPPSATALPASAGFAGIRVEDFTDSKVKISQTGQDGSFRTVCTVSHFNFDDAIVFPGQLAATHLHMYFGNVLTDFTSTGASLAANGDATCQGGPLNRSAYWVPAVIDQGGNVRPAQYMLTYYKRAGAEHVVPYPNGLKMVVGNAMATQPQPGREQPVDAGIDYTWSCGAPIGGPTTSKSRLIPDCAAGEFLTLSLLFPRCSDGRLDSPNHKSHMAYPAYYGASCPSSHPIRHPQLTYNIHWNNNDTNTGGWYLSSDVHGETTIPGGTTTHADWIGAWHPEVLDIMTSGCFNADHDCKGGTISPSLRLVPPIMQGFSPSSHYDPNVDPIAIPLANFGTSSTYAN